MSLHSAVHISVFLLSNWEMKNVMYTQGWQIDFSLWVHISALRLRKKKYLYFVGLNAEWYHLAHLKIAEKSIEVKYQYFFDVFICIGDAFLSITSSAKAEFRR